MQLLSITFNSKKNSIVKNTKKNKNIIIGKYVIP